MPAVARAMKPRIDGMLAAVEAPSRSRVRAEDGSWRQRAASSKFAVRPVMTTATAPKIGPYSITRWWPSRSDSIPKIGERTSSAR